MPRTSLVRGALSISASSGYVTWSSTSCGPWPGHSVMMMTWISERSGTASTVVRVSAERPASATAIVASNTGTLCATDQPMRRVSMALPPPGRHGCAGARCPGDALRLGHRAHGGRVHVRHVHLSDHALHDLGEVRLRVEQELGGGHDPLAEIGRASCR